MVILDELDSLDATNISDDAIVLGSPIILARMEEASRLMDMVDFKPESRSDFDKLRNHTAQMAHLVQEFKYHATREIRLAKRQASTPPVQGLLKGGRVCAVDGCNKQARVNEYCKRHARENGIIVHGKI
jgi:hypothetical protein